MINVEANIIEPISYPKERSSRKRCETDKGLQYLTGCKSKVWFIWTYSNLTKVPKYRYSCGRIERQKVLRSLGAQPYLKIWREEPSNQESKLIYDFAGITLLKYLYRKFELQLFGGLHRKTREFWEMVRRIENDWFWINLNAGARISQVR